MEPASKKRKLDPPSTSKTSAMSTAADKIERNPLLIPVTKEDKDDWQGFCELDSEPAYFNTLLYDWGVRGVKVQEVYSLDPDILLSLAKPTYGLVFLFQYKADELNMQEASCPPHVWFANQTNDSACATVSLLNIVLNLQRFEDVEIGPNLESFKDFTQDFTPALRGDEIGNFEFVKRLHNSFARKMDIFNTDLGLKNKYDDRNKPKAKPKPKPKPRPKAKAKSKATRKKGKGSKKSTLVSESDYEDEPEIDADENEDENAYHFQAYVPIGNDVWMLDGLNRQPVKIGAVPDHSSHPLGWLSLIAGVLQERMDMYQANDINVSLMSLGKDPLIDYRKDLASNINALVAVERRLDDMKPNWTETIDVEPMTRVNGDDDKANGHIMSNGTNVNVKGYMTLNGSTSNGSSTTSEEFPAVPSHLSGLGLTRSLLASTKPPGSVQSTLASPQTTFEDLMHTRTRLSEAQKDFVRLIAAELEDWRSDGSSSQNRRSDYGAVVGRWLMMLCSKDGDDGKQGTVVRDIIEALR